MRVLVTPEIAHRLGIVLFRPGPDAMPLFMQGRVLVEPEPKSMRDLPSGVVPAVRQPLAEDKSLRVFLTNFCYQLIINKFFNTQELKTSKLTTQLTTHFVEALRTTTNNNKQKGNLLAVLLNRYHFSAIRYQAGG